MEQIVLVVDDDVTSLKLATGILEKEYRVAAAINGTMAFKYLEGNTPDLILLDLNMPDMDGFEVMEKLQADAELAKIPVVFLTASQTPQIEAKCLGAGALDYVSKPYVPLVLRSRVQRILELYTYRNKLESIVTEQSRALLERARRVDESQSAIILGMANLIEERDNNTGHHVRTTQAYVRVLAEALLSRGAYPKVLNERFKDMVVKAAPLHDIGKIKIPDRILQKTGALSEEEFGILQNHPRFGADIVEEILGDVEDADFMAVVRDVTLCHHERWDGTGYPSGLRGEEIPLAARIMAIADVFDRLYEEQVVQKGERSLDPILAHIADCAGTCFDPTLAGIFLELKEKLAACTENEGVA